MTLNEAIKEFQTMQQRGTALSAFPTRAAAMLAAFVNARDVIASGVECATGVIDNWSSGDLAEAVNMLDGWREGATDA